MAFLPPPAAQDAGAILRYDFSVYDHIVMVSIDTLRSDGIAANPLKLWPHQHSCSVDLHTEVLDELATSGTFFTNCIAAAPYTSASHATFLTGKWPPRHRVYELFNRRLHGKTLFHHARRLGYRTLLKVDFPLILGEHLGFKGGVDEYYAEDDEAYLSSIDRRGPTFSLAHFGGIHAPYGFHNLRFGGQAYVGKVRELEALVARDEGRHSASSAHLGDDEMGLSLRYRQVLEHFYQRQDYDRLFTLYLEGINHFLRTRFRPFCERLREKLAHDRCLVVLFADHGEEYDEQSYGHQNTVTEGVLRVPLIFHGPGVPPSLHTERVRSVDLAPTLLELMGDPTRGRLRLDGSSLAQTVSAETPYPVRPAFAQVYAADNREYLAFVKRALRSGRKTGSLRHVLLKEAVYDGPFKLMRQEYEYFESGKGWALRPCAARLALERIDDASRWHPHEEPEIRQSLLEKLDRYNRGATKGRGLGDETVDLTDEIRRQLRTLGYRI